MANFIELDTNLFKTFLSSLGFTETVSDNEIVFVKPFDAESKLLVKVYTSIGVGREKARSLGQDAIRVCAVLEGAAKTFGIGKFASVHRTTSQESVHGRVKDRITKAFERCVQWKTKRDTRQAGKDTGHYVGRLGDSVRLTLKVVEKKDWNKRHLFVLKDANDATFTYWTSKDVLQVGGVYEMSARVNGYKIFNHVKQTELIQCVGKRVS